MRNMHTKAIRRRSRRVMPLSAFGNASMLMQMLRDRVMTNVNDEIRIEQAYSVMRYHRESRQFALRCEVSMSDKHQTPQSAYHDADLALAQSMAEVRERPQFAAWAAPVVRPSFGEGHRVAAARREIRPNAPTSPQYSTLQLPSVARSPRNRGGLAHLSREWRK
jgi:hypothetical protein